VTGSVVDHGWERNGSWEREEEVAIGAFGAGQGKPSGGLFEGAIASDLGDLEGEVVRDIDA
jgi:hypothetical protein